MDQSVLPLQIPLITSIGFSNRSASVQLSAPMSRPDKGKFRFGCHSLRSGDGVLKIFLDQNASASYQGDQ